MGVLESWRGVILNHGSCQPAGTVGAIWSWGFLSAAFPSSRLTASRPHTLTAFKAVKHGESNSWCQCEGLAERCPHNAIWLLQRGVKLWPLCYRWMLGGVGRRWRQTTVKSGPRAQSKHCRAARKCKCSSATRGHVCLFSFLLGNPGHNVSCCSKSRNLKVEQFWQLHAVLNMLRMVFSPRLCHRLWLLNTRAEIWKCGYTSLDLTPTISSATSLLHVRQILHVYCGFLHQWRGCLKEAVSNVKVRPISESHFSRPVVSNVTFPVSRCFIRCTAVKLWTAVHPVCMKSFTVLVRSEISSTQTSL